MAHISLKGVKKSFGAVNVIPSLDLDVDDGELLVLLGPSGCAKSTTLRLVAGLESLTGGDIFIDGVNVKALTPKQRGVAMVFQNYALYPHMTVFDNIAFSLKVSRLSKADIREKVLQTAQILQLTPLLDRFPATLSGGQSQRVAIGRAMVRNPKVFLFDEPLSNLDAQLRTGMRAEIKLLHESLRTTMIYVTHDQVEATTLADRIAILEKGLLVQLGTPQEIYRHPVNRFVAGFIGSPPMNIFPAHREGERLCGPGLSLTFGTLPDGLPERLDVGIRPQHMRLCSSEQGHLQGRVKLVEYLGNELLLHVERPDGSTIVALSSDEQAVRHGESIGLSIPEDRFYLFNAEDGATLRQATYWTGREQ